MSTSANGPLVTPCLGEMPQTVGDFIAAFEAFEKRSPHWENHYEVMDENIPFMVPERLHAKARDLAHDATVAWDWQLWRLCHRVPGVVSASELHAWIDFLRRCCREYPEAVMSHRWQRPRLYPPSEPPSPYPVPCEFIDVDARSLLRFAAPLLRGEWQSFDSEWWCAELEKLRSYPVHQFLPDWEFFSLPYQLWDKMRQVPGEGRPLEPRRPRNHYELERAFDIAVRWCERQEKRDRKAAMQALCLRTRTRPPVAETAPFAPTRQLPLPDVKAENDPTAYRPAKEFLDGEKGPQTYTELKRLLNAHPEIRTRKPSPQRLEIHAGDWMRFRHCQSAAGDALDLPAEVVDAAVAEVQTRRQDTRRQAEK